MISFSKPNTATILPIIILCEGFVSVAVEIIAIRQLLPVVGGSVIVTSLIIGVFLLFLALGYKKGGQIQSHLQEKLRTNFLIAASCLGIGFSYFFIAEFFTLAEKIFPGHVIFSLIFYLLCILAPLIYILGQTVPICMNITVQDKRAGIIGGDTLGLSTVGSFLGATMTALFFMQYLGVAWTMMINVCVLLFLSWILSTKNNYLIINIFISACIILIVYMLNVIVESSLFIRTNNYGNYQIVSGPQQQLKSQEKILVINNSFSSFIDANKKGFPYIELIKKILYTDLKLKNKQILVLGAGGFSFSAESNFDNHITYVDIDSQLKQIVIPRFIDLLKEHLIIDDARHFIQNSKNHYDAIILDAYTNLRSIPSFLLTYEFMQAVKNKISENGVAIINVISKANLADTYSKRIDNTIRATFNSCTATPLNYSGKITNIIYVCYKNAENKDTTIYTDNLNRSTTDAFAF